MGTILIGLCMACELMANVTAFKPVQLGGIVVLAAIFIYAILSLPLISLVESRREALSPSTGYLR